jgi:hypothetical protein
MTSTREPHSNDSRLDRILSPDYPICRDDVVWVLEWIKKKVADEAPELLSVPQPRLLRNFQAFAEISLMLIKQRGGCGHETDQLRRCLSEALFGLLPVTDKPDLRN